MIDKKKLRKINAKVQERDNWLSLRENVLDAIDSEVNLGRPAHIRLTIPNTDTSLFFKPNDIKDIVKIKILELEKELISLDSQSLLLNLKDEAKTND